MNQKKRKKGKIIFVILLAFFIFINNDKVKADDKKMDSRTEELSTTTCEDDYSGNQAKINKCKEDAKKCFAKLYPATFAVSTSLENNNKDIKITINNKDTSNKKSYSFDVYYLVTKGNTKIIALGNNTGKLTMTTGKSQTIQTLYDGTADIKVDITIQLNQGKGVSAKWDDVDCNRKFTATKTVTIDAPYQRDSFENESLKEGGICYKYLGDGLTASDISNKPKYEKIKKGGLYSYENIKDLDTANGKGYVAFEKLFPYCFNKKISNVMSDSQILEGIFNAADAVYSSKRESGASEGYEESPADAVVIEDISKTINLTCDALGSYDSSTDKYTSENNVRHFVHQLPDVYKKEIYLYNRNYKDDQSKATDICKVKCKEDLTITYGPPVAVKAGFCFEYEVKVESKVSCESEIYENSAPQMSLYQICEPTPTCSNGDAQYINQAGPNEEFDQCIKDNYAGKYTQKAINSCYKKVYKKGNTNKKSVTLDLVQEGISKMNDGKECTVYFQKAEDADEIYNIYGSKGYYGGYYYKLKGEKKDTLHWGYYKDNVNYVDSSGNDIKTMNCYWNQYSRFYFGTSNRTRRTVGNDKHNDKQWGWGYVDDLYKWDYQPEDGIKTGYVGSNRCHDTCNYIDDHCDDGTYYNFVAPTKSVVTDEYGLNVVYDENRMSALKQYYADYNKYKAAIKECKAAASCDDKTTSTYKMTINNLDGSSTICEVGDDNKNCTSWTDTGKSKNQCEYNTKNPSENGITAPLSTGDSKKTSIVPTDTIKSKCDDIGSGLLKDYQETSIREISGICAGVPGDNQHYRTIIGFPGSWYYAKNASYVYHNPNNEVNYQFVPGKYCVGFTIKESINKAWWNWDQVTQRSASKVSNLNTETKTDAGGKQITVLKNGKYNIKAFIETFGQANWKFNISCFYATTTSSCPPDDECCYTPDNECCGEECPPPGVVDRPFDYTTKAAALDDLFPSTENTSSSGVTNQSNTIESVSPTKLNMVSTNNSDSKSNLLKVENSTVPSRTTGFNWTCKSTILNIKNYPIAPTALIAKIQTDGDSVYNKKEEVDYAFRITRDQIKKIRADNNSRKDNPYATVGNNYYKNTANSLKFYRSKFLDNSEYVTDIAHIKRNKVKHTCNNMRNGKCYNLEDYIKANAASCDRLSN